MKMTIIFTFLFAFCALFAQNISTLEIKTNAECGTCKETLETSLKRFEGIESSNLEVESKVLTIKYDSTIIDKDYIYKIVTRTGYDADSLKADKKAQSKLPDCCKPGGMKK